MQKQIARNLVFSYASRLSALVAVLVLVPLYVRFLGQRLYGEWVVLTSIITYLTLAGLGMDQILANRIAAIRAGGKQAETSALVSTAFFSYGAIGLALVAGFSLFSDRLCILLLHDSAPALALAAMGSLCALSIPLNANIMMLRGFGRVDEDQALVVGTNLTRTVALAAAMLSGLKLLPLALIYGVATIARGLGALIRSLRLSPSALPRLRQFSFPTLRTLLGPGCGFLVLQTAGIVGFGIDNLVIGHALGPEAVASYSVPFSILMAASALVSTASVALLPTITGIYTLARKEALVDGYVIAMRLAILYSGVATIVLWVLGPQLLRLWVGPGIFPGSTTFALQLALFLLQVLIEPPFAVLVASTRHYGTAAMHVVESAINLCLSLWWVRVFGLSGVIAATVIARLATTAWYVPYAALHALDLSVVRAAKVVGPGCVVMLATFVTTVSLWPASGHLPFFAAGGVASLGTLMFVLAFGVLGLSRNERERLFAQLRQMRRIRAGA